ncbi:MAG: hypothetical protein J6P83_11460 [Bacteroidales bacterium]|nr:hypothetical protein [Bacteroidales bacterium]
MKIGRLLFAVVIMLSTFSVEAQDLIVKQDGETIKAYRTDVGNTAVYYRLEDNEESPLLTISKSEVLIIKMQNGEKIVMDEAESMVEKTDLESSAYIPKYPSEPVADPEMIAKAEIGSLIEFYDGTKGVVFYLDGNGHGLAVYLYSPKNLILWQDVYTWRDCVDIEAVPNERRTEIQMGLGIKYCDAAIKQLGLEELPAIKWCRSIGPDWYLPSLGELYQLVVVANLSKATRGPISKALINADGNRIANSIFYFSSSEDDNTNVFSISPAGGVVISKKYDRHSCRAIRMF